MRTVLVNLLAACSSFVTLLAGRLDVAVIQFPEEKAPAELQSALAKANLFEMTNADRTRTANPTLKAATFSSLNAFRPCPARGFSTSTRLKNSSADVEVNLGAGTISFSISFMEGVKAGLRTFQKKVYTGSGALPPGSPHVLGVRQIRGRFPNVAKGQTKMESYLQTTVVLGQYTH